MWIMTAEGWRQLQPRIVVPAPRSGAFRPISLEQAREENAKRVEAYARNVQEYVSSEDGKAELSAIYRDWAAPLFGAFGETIR